MPTQAEALAAWNRYGTWSSYVLQLREGMAYAEQYLPTAQTDAARRTLQGMLEKNRAALAEMDRLFPDAQ